MSGYVLVRRTEDSKEDSIELPTEDDGSLLLSVLQSQFEGASGLRYRNPNTGSWRAIKLSEGVLKAPTPAGWGEHTYYVVTGGGKETELPINPGYYAPVVNPNVAVGYSSDGSKRMKLEEQPVSSYTSQPTQPFVHPAQFQAVPSSRDLIVLGLEWTVTDEDLKLYFEKFGELEHAEVKMNYQTGKSRGFGFIRFKDSDLNQRVCDLNHSIKGRRVDVKPPNANHTNPCKIFVGCLPLKPPVEKEELEAHFSEFGQLADVYIPSPYRGFGFITYKDPTVAQRVMSLQHTLRKSSLNLSLADPKGGAKGHSPQYTSQPQYSQQDYGAYQQSYYQHTPFQGHTAYDTYTAGAPTHQARANYDRGYMDGRAHAQYSQTQAQAQRPGSQLPSGHAPDPFVHPQQRDPVASFPTSSHPSRAPGHEYSKNVWGHY